MSFQKLWQPILMTVLCGLQSSGHLFRNAFLKTRAQRLSAESAGSPAGICCWSATERGLRLETRIGQEGSPWFCPFSQGSVHEMCASGRHRVDKGSKWTVVPMVPPPSYPCAVQ